MSHTFSLTPAAAKRVAFLLESEPAGSALRVSVLGGGCSGFQYHFDFDPEAPKSDDTVIEQEGAKVLVDEISLEMLDGSVLDFAETLYSAAFEIKNPNATANCGCGNSFSVDMS